MLSKQEIFKTGSMAVAPYMLSVIPFGIICGAIGVEMGFNPYLVYAMSIIIFGGASQIVFLQNRILILDRLSLVALQPFFVAHVLTFHYFHQLQLK